ncbi:unnamed protein product [Adineta steineri]|uniref:Uncharacterized protein n=1 Tax=Adineta steineri TaxID=433720 RepID=A0A814AZ17_9BILA|nr:unnamed protein product [Adineta steineri]CAF0860447.1 unnamed protein product [Adineta steineri]CAF0921026.1 unnamed protein product [Adineta steineri]
MYMNEIAIHPRFQPRARPQWLVNLSNKVGYYVYSIADCVGRDLDADCMQSMIDCGVSPNWPDCVIGALCGGVPAFNRCKSTFGK